MRLFWTTLCLCLALNASWAQHENHTIAKPTPNPLHKADTSHIHEATSLLQAFKGGHFHGHFRTFFMATDNQEGLSDYHAWAVGGGLHYSTAVYRGFSFGLSGVYNFNLASSNLSARDAATGARNRYEIGLFDIEDPTNRRDLDRAEDLWIRYQRRTWQVTVGQQAIQTPFINHQDGRMRPSIVAGTWAEARPTRQVYVQGGWLWSMSPRSTVKWYSVGESIGLYPPGLNPDGTRSGYEDHLKSKGIGLLGIQHPWGRCVKMQYWNQYVENIFNTALVQADVEVPTKAGHRWIGGLQLTRQDALADGGHTEVQRTYFTKSSHANIISTQLGWAKSRYRFLAAYTRITNDGRFLSPREWGREPFYTFMARERVEGAGNVHAITGRFLWRTPAPRWQIELGYGHFYLPEVQEVRLNKYAFPAFTQTNVDVRYTFSGALAGLRAQLLYVYKGRLGDTYGNNAYVINRVNMSHLNLILNYTY